jgi:hypothetical protein
MGILFTAILNERVKNFLDTNGLLNEDQAEVRTGYSTTDHIFSLKLPIDKLISQKKK